MAIENLEQHLSKLRDKGMYGMARNLEEIDKFLDKISEDPSEGLENNNGRLPK